MRNFLIYGALTLLSLASCKKSEPSLPVNYGPITGEIQILNGCGIAKASGRVRNYLLDKGFDVIETGNAPSWNFPKTLIVLRKPDWSGLTALKESLNTDRVILLRNPSALVDVSIYLGKDIEELLIDEPKEKS
jgi:hypothetical protein